MGAGFSHSRLAGDARRIKGDSGTRLPPTDRSLLQCYFHIRRCVTRLNLLTIDLWFLHCYKWRMVTIFVSLLSGFVGSILGAVVSGAIALKVGKEERNMQLRLRLQEHLHDFSLELDEEKERISFEDYKNPSAPSLSVHRYESQDARYASMQLVKKVRNCRSLAVDAAVIESLKYIEGVLLSLDFEKGVLSRNWETKTKQQQVAYSHQEFFTLRASLVQRELHNTQLCLAQLIATGRSSIGIWPLTT